MLYEFKPVQPRTFVDRLRRLFGSRQLEVQLAKPAWDAVLDPAATVDLQPYVAAFRTERPALARAR
jgi:hypothetical protein